MTQYDPRNVLRQQPVAVAGALRAILYALILLGILQLTAEQLAGIAIAAELVLGLFVWNTATSTSTPNLKAGTTGHIVGSAATFTVPTPPEGP